MCNLPANREIIARRVAWWLHSAPVMTHRTLVYVVITMTLPAVARASEHMMVVNEVMRSASGDATAQLVELWDTGNEPFPAAAYSLDIFDADATKLGRVNTPGIMGGSGPQYYVISTPAANAALGITGDAPLTVTLPRDGQACFIGANERLVHCVAWGCVRTKITPATPLGASPGDGASLQRTPNGAILTVAAPTPGGANMVGVMDEPCQSELDGAGDFDGEPQDGGSGGCCQANREAPLVSALGVALILWRRRRRVV
jgi:hypothetical protein